MKEMLSVILLLCNLFFETSAQRPIPQSDIRFKEIGEIQPRNANEIKASLLSIGAETMDRDFTIYDNWKSYLGPLGFKKARILSGWAKTEPTPKKYNWAWMDNIVNDMVNQGVTPWVTLCYGNPLYTTFKDDSRGDPPRTEEAYKAWESYVMAYVYRYKDKINEYEIWNEPRHGKKITPQEYATLVIRTTKAIKSIHPEALINILALDHTHFNASVGEADDKDNNNPKVAEYAAQVLQILKDQEFLDNINAVTYHPYTWNPDDTYNFINKFREFVKSYDSNLIIIQGETGAPSEFNTKRALSNYPWTERSQAKYALRRIIGDLGHNIPTSYFSIADMFYEDEVNNKALLKARPDKTIERPKQAYYSLQNVSSIFDERFESISDPLIRTETKQQVSNYHFKDDQDNCIVALWLSDKIPGDHNEFIITEVEIPGYQFNNPVYVDMLTGKVIQIEPEQISYEEGSIKFSSIIIPDYPILIVEKSVLEIM